ncbi:MAG: hypothetical protein QME58_14025 [Bacteroidota bacterium]|nr:hypothetical protein [Bacteroidota bacterium]
MIYSTLDQILGAIQAAVGSEVKELGSYSGQFEEGGEWNPLFPAVFASIVKAEPIIETDTIIIGFSITANIYVGIKNNISSNRAFLDNILNIMDGFGISFPTSVPGVVKFSTEAVFLHGYFFGIDVYRIEVNIIKQL